MVGGSALWPCGRAVSCHCLCAIVLRRCWADFCGCCLGSFCIACCFAVGVLSLSFSLSLSGSGQWFVDVRVLRNPHAHAAASSPLVECEIHLDTRSDVMAVLDGAVASLLPLHPTEQTTSSSTTPTPSGCGNCGADSGDGKCEERSQARDTNTAPHAGADVIVARVRSDMSHSILRVGTLPPNHFFAVRVPLVSGHVAAGVGLTSENDDNDDDGGALAVGVDDELVLPSTRTPAVALRCLATATLDTHLPASLPRLKPELPPSSRFLLGDLVAVPATAQLESEWYTTRVVATDAAAVVAATASSSSSPSSSTAGASGGFASSFVGVRLMNPLPWPVVVQSAVASVDGPYTITTPGDEHIAGVVLGAADSISLAATVASSTEGPSSGGRNDSDGDGVGDGAAVGASDKTSAGVGTGTMASCPHVCFLLRFQVCSALAAQAPTDVSTRDAAGAGADAPPVCISRTHVPLVDAGPKPVASTPCLVVRSRAPDAVASTGRSVALDAPVRVVFDITSRGYEGPVLAHCTAVSRGEWRFEVQPSRQQVIQVGWSC